MKHLIYIQSTIILLLCNNNTFSQAQVIDSSQTVAVAKKKIPEQKLPFFNFKNGIGIATPDSSYSINIRFRIQNRFLMNTVNTEDLSPASWEARVRRCRLSFTGHVYNPKITYYLQLSFSRGDMDWSSADVTNQNVSPNVLRDAMLFYKPAKNLQLGFGQGKLPGNRQRVVSSGALQFYDRSPVNAIFTLDRDFGVFTTYSFNVNKFKTILKTAVSSGEGRNSNSSSPGLAYTGRIELLPFGEFKDNGDYFEGDVLREEKLKISIGGSYHFNDQATRTGGQLGRDLYELKSFQTYIGDLVLKYKGLAISSEYIKRETFGSPITKNAAGATRFIVTGDGINSQLSYCFKSNWEIAIRHSVVNPTQDVQALQNQINQYGAGVTKYLMKHKVKGQFNVFYNNEKNLSSNTNLVDNFFAVLQFEVGI